MSRDLVIVLSYCDTQHKLQILNNLLDKLVEYNKDVCLISPIVLDTSIQSKCDYFIYTKDNPILSWPEEYGYYAWMVQSYEDIPFKINYIGSDYGWTVLYQLKVVLSLIENINYENVILMNYDLDISENPLKLINNDTNVMFNTWISFHKHKKDVSPLLLSKWKKGDFESIINCVNKSEYMNKHVSPENHLKQIIHSLGIEYTVPDFTLSDLSEYKINSKFDTWSEINSDIYGFNLFVTNFSDINSIHMGKFCIWMYNFSKIVNPFDIIITLSNGETQTFRIEESKNTMIVTEYDNDDISNCKIVLGSDIIDISNVFAEDKITLKQFMTYV